MRSAVLFGIAFLAIVMMVTVSEACDCNYQSGGCVISRPASSGHACKCTSKYKASWTSSKKKGAKLKGSWTCEGNSIACDSKKRLCKNPDKSEEACNLGNGDCGGY